MKAFRVVADSSCLIGLVHIGLFESVKDLFAEIYIPSAVYDEVVVKGKGKIGAHEVEAAVKAGWLTKTSVQDTLAVNALLTTLSRGEAEVIILATELGLDYALIDESTARNMANLMNVNTIGTLGIIDIAITAGIAIDKKASVDHLRQVGFRISEKLYQKVLKP
jgi:predicted nucleic acid-binding protein